MVDKKHLKQQSLTSSKRDDLLETFKTIEVSLHKTQPLIHCLTNHITINDCANVVLMVGGKPMMAEHLLEVEAVTKSAGALAVNLGNITDERMAAMLLSGKTASTYGIPSIIDAVGVASSPLRCTFAKDFIATCKPSVIKGNMSEIKALAGYTTSAKGVDVSALDHINEVGLASHLAIAQSLAQATGSVVVATGVMDLVTDGITAYVVKNGTPHLARVTGTGCMLNVMIATYLSSGYLLESALLGVLVMGISGEVAQTEKGLSTFKTHLLDAISLATIERIQNKINVKVVDCDGF